MKQLTDEQVLRRVHQGEHSAYLILFDRYYLRVERYAACLLRDADGARAAASATFHQAFRLARRRRSHTLPYPAVLFRICRRKILREASRTAALAMPLRAGCEAVESAAAGLEELPLAVILSAERDALIQSAMESLSLADQEILHLAFDPDLSREDVGAILRQPLQETVTALLGRALRRLGTAVIQAGYPARDFEGRLRDFVKHAERT